MHSRRVTLVPNIFVSNNNLMNKDGSHPTQVIVHPLVLLSVVDHYNRVARNTKNRVLGVLLGQVTGSEVNVANSFAVPFEEDDKDPDVWFIDHNYFEAMYDMFKKVNGIKRF